ncbi:MAG: hypothetical protein ACHQEM_08635 [Chitinophagales bacterium]
MLRLKFIPLFVFLGFFFSSCNSSMRILATWVDKEKVAAMPKVQHKIFIMAWTQNFEAQSALENDLGAAAEAKGVKVVKAINAFGPLTTRGTLPSKEILLKAIRSQGCDGIFMLTLVNKESETYYQPASYSTYTPYGGYGTWGGYYDMSYTVFNPGYYTTDNTYFVQSNLYNSETEQLLVAMQSKLVNPGEVQKASKKYTQMLVQELENHGFLQGKYPPVKE